MATTNGIKLIFGAGTFASHPLEFINPFLDTVEDLGIQSLDVATLYGDSEALLGQVGAASRFTIDTKHPGAFSEEPCTEDVITNTLKQSLKLLKSESVDVYYLHAPDRRLPFKETLRGLDELHKAGSFKRLGLSNFSPEEVEEAIRVAKENDFVVPSVYQGNYSAVARRTEHEILPVLRRHGIAFYAYSPIAGGFLAKTRASLADEGRFSAGDFLAQIYNNMYNRDKLLDALDVWGKIAEDEGVPRAEMAYRWIAYHSLLSADKGDAIVLGARKEDQLRETWSALRRGPLSEAAVKRIDEMWETIKDETFLDNFQSLSSKN